MKIVLLAMLFSIIICGCAGSRAYLSGLENQGIIRTDIADDESYDYKVFIRNLRDIGWDGGNKQDRINAVNLMFKDSCNQVEIVGEIPIKTGRGLTGRELITYLMKVKCIR